MKYEISEKALEDLGEIWLYTVELWSVQQADRYYQLIIDEIEYIAQYPDSGKSIDFVKVNYHVSKVKSHLIFYRQVNNRVSIIRILHEKMDIENRLSD
ncbi:MAG: type II toxin-antitoxin system RelE/ParE family toxin [Chitinophagaceae bacterium]|jgi:toxin ParE1/3/4